MSLSEQQKREFRQRGHGLKPVVTIGSAGLTDAVTRELHLSLEHHELMKVRVSAAGRDQRRLIIDRLCSACRAELVQSIGNIALIYRERQGPEG
jgi:RNA-binding protein